MGRPLDIIIHGARGSHSAQGSEFTRHGTNTACVEIALDARRKVILDCGSGLQQLVPDEGVRRYDVLLTHYHWDHIQGLLTFPPLHDERVTIVFHGPVCDGVDVRQALEGAIRSPWWPVSLEAAAAQVAYVTVTADSLAVGDLEVRAAPTRHPQGGVAYRIESDGRALVYATDHEHGDSEFDRPLLELAGGADILIHDAQYDVDEYSRFRDWGHSHWRHAAELAKSARARRLLLFHHDPARVDDAIDGFVEQARAVFPRTEAARDGMHLTLGERERLLARALRSSEAGGERSEDSRTTLGSCEPFLQVSSQLVDRLFDAMVERSFSEGQTLMRQGDPGDALFVILEGHADAIVHRDDGEDSIVGSVASGEVVGEMALLTRQPRVADVVATSDVRALKLEANDFDDLADRHPELRVVLTEVLAARLGQASHDGMGGKTLEGYRIERCVGRGGMAVVYEAFDAEEERRVALKMMSHTLVYHAGSQARFETEAKIVQGLNHDNIVKLEKIFSAFRTSFLVMEFCDGPTLSRIQRRFGKLPEAEARKVLGQLAAALLYVHERNITHRDLKPSNVMFKGGVAKLMDFGLAKSDLPLSERTVTATGAILGTPYYMAPEQLAGEEVGPGTDVYALGVIAYELITGALLFRGKNLLELAREKLDVPLPDADRMGDGVSDAMHAFLTQALRNDQADRSGALEMIVGWAGRISDRYLSIPTRKR